MIPRVETGPQLYGTDFVPSFLRLGVVLNQILYKIKSKSKLKVSFLSGGRPHLLDQVLSPTLLMTSDLSFPPQVHGSRDGGVVDAIQIESPEATLVDPDPAVFARYADALGAAIARFHQRHYSSAATAAAAAGATAATDAKVIVISMF